MIIDSGRLSNVRPAPGGGVLVDALIGRSGIQLYRKADGTTIRAYRPPEEVRAADFVGAPLTVGHPAGGVTPENYRSVVVGHARERAGEEVLEDGVYPRQVLQLADAEAIADAKAGRLVELSCGYDAVQDWTPGIVDGQPYDVVFREITPNHIALGGEGFARAGRKARLLLDSEEILMTDAQTPRVDDRDALVAKIGRLEGENAKLVQDAADLLAEVDRVKGELTAAEAAVAKLDERVADGVAKVVAFRDSARKTLGAEYVFDGKDESAVRADVRAAKVARIKGLDSSIEVADSASDEWLDACLTVAERLATKQEHDYQPTKAAPAVHDGDEDIQTYIRRLSAEAYRRAE